MVDVHLLTLDDVIQPQNKVFADLKEHWLHYNRENVTVTSCTL